MLIAYETAVQNLIQSPQSPTPLVPLATIDAAINKARFQLAGETECIRKQGTLALSSGVAEYPFFQIAVLSPSGAGQAIAVRLVKVGNTRIDLRPWEWFFNYYINNGVIGTPSVAAQLGQGENGSLFFNPVPNLSLTATVDIAAFPNILVDDTTEEGIPYPWHDAVPFYAAWLVLMSLQRQSDANSMYQRYETLAKRGRQISTSTVLPDNMPGGVGAHMAADKTTLAIELQRQQR